MSNGKIVSKDTGAEDRLEGCLCEYIREDYRDRLEQVIERGGGGKPETPVNFANIIIEVNRALEKHLAYLENLGNDNPPEPRRTRSRVKAKPRAVLVK